MNSKQLGKQTIPNRRKKISSENVVFHGDHDMIRIQFHHFEMSTTPLRGWKIEDTACSRETLFLQDLLVIPKRKRQNYYRILKKSLQVTVSGSLKTIV